MLVRTIGSQINQIVKVLDIDIIAIADCLIGEYRVCIARVRLRIERRINFQRQDLPLKTVEFSHPPNAANPLWDQARFGERKAGGWSWLSR